MASPLSETTCNTLISSISSSIAHLPPSSSNGSILSSARSPSHTLSQQPPIISITPSTAFSDAGGGGIGGPNAITELTLPLLRLDHFSAGCSNTDPPNDAINDASMLEMPLHYTPSGGGPSRRPQMPVQRASSLSSGRQPLPPRRWPSLRARLGRLGSLRKFSSITLPGASGQQPPGSPGQRSASSVLPRIHADDLHEDHGMDVESQLGGTSCANADANESMSGGGGMWGEDCDLEGGYGGKQSTSSYLKEQFFSFFQPSDNKLAMKLFGNRNALIKERKRQQQQGKWVIHPCSNFR